MVKIFNILSTTYDITTIYEGITKKKEKKKYQTNAPSGTK